MQQTLETVSRRASEGPDAPKETAAARNKLYLCLAVLFGTALALRLWGIWFGLPFSFKADEYHEVFRALELGTGNFNFERTGKGGYFYILFVEYGGLFVALKLAGVVNSAQDFARYFVQDPSIFYLVGRATTAVIGALNVFLAFRLGTRGYGVGAGILAAVFLAVDFLNTEHSHFITVDVPMTCLATAALLFAVRMVADGRSSDYRWAALFAALATTTKLPAILLLVPLLIGHWYVVRQRGGGIREFLVSRNLWWAAGVFTAVWVVTNPGLIVNPPIPGFSGGEDSALAEGDGAEELIGSAPNLFVYYLAVMKDSMGWPLFSAAFAGLIYAVWKRTPTDMMLVSFAAALYVIFASTDSSLYFPRYSLPIIVVLAVLAGRLLYAIWPSGSMKRAAAVALVAMLLVVPGYRTLANNYLLTQTDTRTLAKAWFDENIPDGSKVLIEGLKIEPTKLTVPLQDSPDNMRTNIEYYKSREPGKATYLKFVLQVEAGRTYDLELVTLAELKSLDFYKDEGIQYLVIRPLAFAGARGTSRGSRFLDELQSDPELRLIKSFRFDPRSQPGPDIDIYEVHIATREVGQTE